MPLSPEPLAWATHRPVLTTQRSRLCGHCRAPELREWTPRRVHAYHGASRQPANVLPLAILSGARISLSLSLQAVAKPINVEYDWKVERGMTAFFFFLGISLRACFQLSVLSFRMPSSVRLTRLRECLFAQQVAWSLCHVKSPRPQQGRRMRAGLTEQPARGDDA